MYDPFLDHLFYVFFACLSYALSYSVLPPLSLFARLIFGALLSFILNEVILILCKSTLDAILEKGVVMSSTFCAKSSLFIDLLVKAYLANNSFNSITKEASNEPKIKDCDLRSLQYKKSA